MNTEAITYHSVLNLLLSKTSPDGIYIDPETKEEFDMNSPYDRADIVTATMSEMKLKTKQRKTEILLSKKNIFNS